MSLRRRSRLSHQQSRSPGMQPAGRCWGGAGAVGQSAGEGAKGQSFLLISHSAGAPSP